MSEEKRLQGLAISISNKIDEEQHLCIMDTDLDPLEIRFRHKTVPSEIDLDWTLNLVKQMIKYYETCDSKNWYYEWSYRPLSEKLCIDRAKKYLPLLQKAASNVEELNKLFKRVKEQWTSEYPKKWDEKIGLKTYGELMDWLGRKDRENYERSDWKGVTSSHIASFLGLTMLHPTP